MQTIGPYRLLHALGTCPVGGVWSAADTADNQVTVAILNASAAHDPGWRNAFAATANSLAQSGQVALVAGDYSGPIPWIASSARDASMLAQVFVALGMDYRPEAAAAAEPGQSAGSSVYGSPVYGSPGYGAPAQPISDAPPPVSVPPRPVSPPPQPVSGGAPDASSSMQTMPLAAQPMSPAAQPPPAAQPTSGAGSVPGPRPPVMEPPQHTPSPYSAPPAGSPYTVSPYSVPPAEPPRRRTGVLVGVVVLVLVVLVGGGVALAAVLLPGEDDPQPAPTTEPPVAQGTTPAGPPEQPGVEPPQEGDWPTDWPAFADGEPVTPMTNLEGLGFSFAVPEGWDCTNAAQPQGLAHYTCGPAGGDDQTGGELIVRECPDPCDAEQRVDLRTAEEAWGVRWTRDGFYRCWGETTEVAGEEQYGLAMVGYWRTSEEGRLNRQLVFRMTAPVDQADDIRKIANAVRDGIL